jgi:UDP-2,3-diacylglucosamine pyrophosphatase LpxH
LGFVAVGFYPPSFLVKYQQEQKMKHTQKLVSSACLGMMLLSITGCSAEKIAPLWEGKSSTAAKTSLILSDIHLGVDASFAENVTNVPCLLKFLKRAQATLDLDEIVFDGDLFDGWYLPFSFGVIRDYAEFYEKVAKANQGFVDTVNHIIKEGKIKVVYVPGNHDVDFSREIVESIFPGITQARDSAGVGTYRTGLRQEVAIEHGHRYNAFCAPDSLTDPELRKNAVLFGPGYFYTRIAATSLTQGHPKRSFDFPDFGKPANPSVEVENAYNLYLVWNAATASIGVPGMGFEDKVIPCGVAGYQDFYSLADLVPLYRDGKLTKTLFSNIDFNWKSLQILNRVNALQEYIPTVLESAKLPATDQKAYSDYFDCDRFVDVVVFGHTHAPMIVKDKAKYEGKIYANTGTWIDHNLDGDTTRNFVKIVSSDHGDDVGLYTYQTDDTMTMLA